MDICHRGDGGICSGRVSGADSCPENDMASSGSDMWLSADWSGTGSWTSTSTSTMCVVVVVGSLNVVLTGANPCANLDGLISPICADSGGCIGGETVTVVTKIGVEMGVGPTEVLEELSTPQGLVMVPIAVGTMQIPTPMLPPCHHLMAIGRQLT